MPYRAPSKALGGLDYMRCKRVELDSFYKTRTGTPVPHTVKNKSQLIRLLRQVDADPGVFRFLDLPAELRNAIYSELLVVGKMKCKPNILRVSKEVYGEARSILYDRIEIQMNLAATKFSWSPPYLRHCITSLGQTIAIVWPDKNQQVLRLPLLYSLRDWTRRLSTFTHVHVKMDLQLTISPQQGLEPLINTANHELYSLCSFLTPSTTLKSFDIEVTTPKTVNNIPFDNLRAQVALKEVLWPVNILPSKVQVKVHGAAATLDKSFASTRELQLPHLSDILRQLRTFRILISELEGLVGQLEASWTAGLRPLLALDSTVKAYLNTTGPVFSAEHHGMQGCLRQAEEILPVAIEILLEIATRKKVLIGNNGGRGDLTRLEIHRLNLVRIKREAATLLGQSVNAS